MTSKKTFFAMIGVLVLLAVLIAGGTYYGHALLQKESQQLVDLKLENHLLEEQQVSLAKAKKDIEQYAELEGIAKSIVPQDKDQAKAVRELVIIANELGITFSSIGFPESSLGQKAPPKPSSDSDDPSAAPKAPPVTQVTPVKGIEGVYLMELSLQQSGSVPYDTFIRFLERLEQNRRTAQVSNITLRPDPENRSQVAFGLTINLYIKP